MPSRRDLLSSAVAGLILPTAAPAREQAAASSASGQPGAPWIDVRAFGARGDGVADDSAAINRAIATLGRGRTLYFPAGVYKVSVSDGVERALTPLPVGANVHMERGAWLTAGPDQPTLTFLTPLGDNILQVNIDGGSFPPSGRMSARWLNQTSGIRAYHAPDYGLGAANVSIVNSEIRNVETGIRADGARHWRVSGCKIHRTALSAVIFGFHEGQDCFHNIVSGNVFESLGDTAVAFFQLGGKALGNCAYNVVANNTAKDTNQRAAGFAFDVEAGDVDRQHHIVFSANVVEQTIRDLPHAVCGFVMNNVSHGLMVGNIARGSSGTEADVGYNMIGSRHGLITANIADNFRGCGINVDGSERIDILDNHISDCGGGLYNAPVRLALAFDTSRCSVAGNTIEIASNYPHFQEDSGAIAAWSDKGIAIRDLRISENNITIPAGSAILVRGTERNPVKGVFAHGNLLGRPESPHSPPAPGQGWALQLSFVQMATISNTVVREAARGFALRDCLGATLADSELTGDGPLAALYDFTGSSGIRVRNTRCYQEWATAIVAPGLGTIWENDDAVRTEAKGFSDPIASGGAIPHGLIFPPSFVSAIPAGSAETSGVRISGITATHFTLEFAENGTRRFIWEARV
jgi:hypothetical protein